MIYETILSAEQLAALQHATQPVVVFDCSFELTDHGAGQSIHDAGHVPGAHYLHLDRELSAEKTGSNGRHPLPDSDGFIRCMAERGVSDVTQVVAYDNPGGMYAARLWWMLRWVGHEAVAVLDGGLAAWSAAGMPIAVARSAPATPGSLSRRLSRVMTVDYAGIQANLESHARLVLDARAPDRFRGENETLDRVGGHIPGARNRLFKDNLGTDFRFKPAGQLRREFDEITGGRAADELINQCGSGVTA